MEKQTKTGILTKLLNSALLAVLILTLTAMVVYASVNNDNKLAKIEQEKTVKEFLMSSVKRDYKNAKDLTAGIVLFNLNNTAAIKDDAHIVTKIETFVEITDQTWAKVRAELETVNPQNNIDVHWYNIYLVKDGTWKIYKIEETEPIFKPGNIDNKDVEDAKKAFVDFCNAVFQRQYDDAGKYLIGRAKISHEQAGSFLKDAIITEDEVKINSAKPLSGNDKHLILQINYTLDGRELNVIVSCYRTKEGWKIYNVSQT